MEKNKEFVIGHEYQLKRKPICVATYKGNFTGKGITSSGELSYAINMSEPKAWSDITLTTLDETKGEDLSIGIRTFDTGANRNSDEGKLDFEGFLSPTVLEAYAVYMNSNRKLENGNLRDSDNWQKGIPKDAYMKSMWRHFFDVWKDHRGLDTNEDEITNLCGLLFNVSGMLHEKLKEVNND